MTIKLPSLILHFSIQGVLDLLANRCLASGTNAWTDTDHTCYTMTNAGSEGFLNLMPVYLDHVLYPTLTVSITHGLHQGILKLWIICFAPITGIAFFTHSLEISNLLIKL